MPNSTWMAKPSVRTASPPRHSIRPHPAWPAATITLGPAHGGPCPTGPHWNLQTAEVIGIDDFQAKRAPDDRYRTVPLRALWSMDKVHKGGFYHDGRFATLSDVVNHYNNHFRLDLSDQDKRNLIEYL